MATYTLATLFPGQVGQVPYIGKDKHYLLRQRVTIPAASYANSDVLEVVGVKAGTLVKSVSTIVVQSGAGTTFSASVGDGASATGFDGANDLKASAGTEYHSAPGTDANATAGGKYYSTADTIDLTLTLSSATGTAIVDVIVECVDLSV